jgi:hypothetical protein
MMGTAMMTLASGSTGAVAGATGVVGGAASAATSGVVAGVTAAGGGREYYPTLLASILLTLPWLQFPPSELVPPPLSEVPALPPRRVEPPELPPPP